MFPLHELVCHAARFEPDRLAVICEGRALTYTETEERSRSVAAFLISHGLRPGDRVALWAPNCMEFLELFYGTSMAGGVAVPLDRWWQVSDVVAAVETCSPAFLFLGRDETSKARGHLGDLQRAGVDVVVSLDPDADGVATYADVLNTAPLATPMAVDLDGVALILFTSGSTGRPKGAAHTHRGLASVASIMALELGLAGDETTLHLLPMFSSCLEQLVPLTYVASTHVIMPRFDAAKCWELIGEHAVTHIDAVPTVLRRLFDDRPPAAPESLRTISYASEPMPAQLIRDLTRYAPGVKFVQFYGMIEHLCLTTLRPEDQLRESGTVGRPMVGTSIQLRDEAGQQVAAGEVGEVVAASPTLMAGYWGDEETTNQVVSAGWMKTGDLAFTDPDGHLVLAGRIKEIIKTGGMTVIPREVEEVLREHSAVSDVAVVGVPSDHWGEEVHAFVVTGSGETLLDDPSPLLAHCRERLPAYKCPKHVEFVRDLPRTGIGKIARSRLGRSGPA